MGFGAVGEAAIGGAEGDVAVGAAGAPGDGGTLHFLDGGDAAEGPEVGVGYPGELLCGKRMISYCVKNGIGAMGTDYARLTGSRKSRAALRPALAPWSPSGAKRMVAPLEPPVPVCAS